MKIRPGHDLLQPSQAVGDTRPPPARRMSPPARSPPLPRHPGQPSDPTLRQGGAAHESSPRKTQSRPQANTQRAASSRPVRARADPLAAVRSVPQDNHQQPGDARVPGPSSRVRPAGPPTQRTSTSATTPRAPSQRRRARPEGSSGPRGRVRARQPIPCQPSKVGPGVIACQVAASETAVAAGQSARRPASNAGQHPPPEGQPDRRRRVRYNAMRSIVSPGSARR